MRNLKMKPLKTTMVLAIIMLLAPTFTNAQDKELTYKDVVVENPNAEADMKVVNDYANALVNNDLTKAAKLLTEDFMGYGPAVNDSINKQNNINAWKENHKVRTNQKIGFVSQTFRVLQGDLKGNWVSQWGTYTFTQNGKNIEIPYQVTARVANGMINRSTIYFDNLAVLQKLGYEITPPKQ